MTFTKEDLKIIALGLAMYKAKVKKALKQAEELQAGEKEVKSTFLKTETLINRINQENE